MVDTALLRSNFDMTNKLLNSHLIIWSRTCGLYSVKVGKRNRVQRNPNKFSRIRWRPSAKSTIDGFLKLV